MYVREWDQVPRVRRRRAPGVSHTERIDLMFFLKSIHPQTHQRNFITRNSRFKLTDVWVSCLERNHSSDTEVESGAGAAPQVTILKLT